LKGQSNINMPNQTTLILGAGASYSYGFPTGLDLRKKILNLESQLDLFAWIQVRSATRFKDCINTSLGVLNPNLFLGRLFS
jgi:hypothetical protein